RGRNPRALSGEDFEQISRPGAVELARELGFEAVVRVAAGGDDVAGVVAGGEDPSAEPEAAERAERGAARARGMVERAAGEGELVGEVDAFVREAAEDSAARGVDEDRRVGEHPLVVDADRDELLDGAHVPR